MSDTKWHLLSGALGIAATVWVFVNDREPEPPAKTWPPGGMPQSLSFADPPLGAHRCQTEDAPAPVEMRFCMATPDAGLEICDTTLVHVDGAPSHCEVASCPALPDHGETFDVMLGCFLVSEEAQ